MRAPVRDGLVPSRAARAGPVLVPDRRPWGTVSCPPGPREPLTLPVHAAVVAPIRAGRPVRVYGGVGAPTDTALFWDRGGRAFDAMGDCVRLVRPNGRTMYRLSVGGGSCD